MIINILQAKYGDAILIKFDENGKARNILIDSVPKEIYKGRDRRTNKEINGVLKNELDLIFSNGEIIDLLIITHVDDDHIGGIISSK